MRVKPGGNLFSKVPVRGKACVLVGQHKAVVAESDLLRADDFNRRAEFGILRHGDRFAHGDDIAVAAAAQRLCQGIAFINGCAVCIGYKNLLQFNRLFGQGINILAVPLGHGDIMRNHTADDLLAELRVGSDACSCICKGKGIITDGDPCCADDFNRRADLGIFRHGDRFAHGDNIAVSASAQRLCQGIAFINGCAACIGYKNLPQFNRLFGQRINYLAALMHNGNRMGIKTAEHLIAELRIRLNHSVCIGQDKAIGAKRNLLCADKRDLCGNFRIFRHIDGVANRDDIAVAAAAQRLCQRIAFVQKRARLIGNNDFLFRLRNLFEGIYKCIFRLGLFHRMRIKTARNRSFNIAVRRNLRLFGCKNQPVAVPCDKFRADDGKLCGNNCVLGQIHRGIDRDHISVRAVFQRFIQAVTVVQNRSACIGNGDKLFIGKKPQGRIQRNTLDRGVCVINAVFLGCK